MVLSGKADYVGGKEEEMFTFKMVQTTCMLHPYDLSFGFQRWNDETKQSPAPTYFTEEDAPY